jgi:phage gpG-like protein
MKRFLDSLNKFDKAASGLLEAIGPLVSAGVQQVITDFDKPGNAPLTKQLKGSKGPLKDSGELRASITHRIKKDGKNDSLVVGTNLAHAPLLNFGGTITAKSARMLTIPATREVKLHTNTKGVKGFLTLLEGRGWSIAWRGGSVLGTPPLGQKGMGLKLTAKVVDGKKQKPAYLLYYRKKSVTIPARRFMRLTKENKKELRQFIREQMKGAIEL